MNFTYEAHNDTVGIFYLEGNLIGETDGIPLTDAFAERLAAGARNFVMDLTELRHINSSGLGVLITLLTKARKVSGEVVLTNPSEFINNILLITKLNSVFSIHPDTDSALESLKPE
ncbi:MAG: STAS domain-containing protein [Bacteroidia bacterium]